MNTGKEYSLAEMLHEQAKSNPSNTKTCHLCGGDAYKRDPEGVLWCLPCLKRTFVNTYVRPEPKVGRNDKCPCESGLKYKKCCIHKSS